MSFLRIAKRLRARLAGPEDEEEQEAQPQVYEHEEESAPTAPLSASSSDDVKAERMSPFTEPQTIVIETPRIAR